MPATERRECVVVGAGLLGLATARALAERGHDVVCMEAASIGHEWSGSKGTSRIFRLSYDDPFYVALARRALGCWRDLEASAGEQLLWPCGLLSFGAGRDELVAGMAAGGAVAEQLSADAVAERFPRLAPAGPAVYDPAAAVVLADRALAALRGPHGADEAFEVRQQAAVVALRDGEHAIDVETTTGSIAAAVAVVCAGAGSVPLLRGAGIACDLRATLEQVAYFAPAGAESAGALDAAGGLDATALAGLPAIVRRTGVGDVDAGGQAEHVGVYGLPSPDRGWFKLGLHHAGTQVAVGQGSAPGEADPAPTSTYLHVPVEGLAPDDAMAAELEASAGTILRGFEGTPRLVERCVYDSTADEDFVIDRVGRIVVGAGTSGHGFKFGPILGSLLAELASGVSPSVELGRFSLRRAAVSAGGRH